MSQLTGIVYGLIKVKILASCLVSGRSKRWLTRTVKTAVENKTKEANINKAHCKKKTGPSNRINQIMRSNDSLIKSSAHVENSLKEEAHLLGSKRETNIERAR